MNSPLGILEPSHRGRVERQATCHNASAIICDVDFVAVPRPPQARGGYRICLKCGVEKPETSEFFYWRRESGDFRTVCKECFKAAKTARYRADPEKARAVARRSYQQIQPDGTKKGMAAKRRNIAGAPERYAAINERYETAHRDERLRRRQDMHEANRDDDNRKAREWYYANRERAIASAMAWIRAHPAEALAHAHRTRAKRAAVFSDVTPEQLRQLWASYRGRCAYCDVRATELDHIIPLSKGGDNTAGNLVPACFDCNRSKAGKWLDVWLFEQGCVLETA